jgi:xanthine/CO dehydrogenase XdhC/CoxF family maturation factor
VVDLAARANLLVYDPQNSRVFAPPALAGKVVAAIPPPRVTLQITGNAPNVKAIVTLDDRVMFDATVASRREAHRHARALTLEQGLDHYAVKDPTRCREA